MPYAQQTCAMIEQGMEADDRQRLFGDRRLDPEVQESLPLELISGGALPLSCHAYI